jgi:rhodanese-related sulfurtransferase
VGEIKSLLEAEAPVMVYDSRPKRPKYDKGHIPGAVSLPDSKFEEYKGLLPQDKSIPLVFYCGGYI